jgi:hypothetical protein
MRRSLSLEAKSENSAGVGPATFLLFLFFGGEGREKREHRRPKERYSSAIRFVMAPSDEEWW